MSLTKDGREPCGSIRSTAGRTDVEGHHVGCVRGCLSAVVSLPKLTIYCVKRRLSLLQIQDLVEWSALAMSYWHGESDMAVVSARTWLSQFHLSTSETAALVSVVRGRVSKG